MALRWIEGFETRQSGTYGTRLYGTLAGAPTSYPAGRKLGSAARGSNYQLITPHLVASVGNTWTVGFGLKIETISGSNVPIVYLASAGTEQLRVQFAASATTPGSYNAVVKRGATTLATSVDIVLNSWHYFEFQAVVRTSTNGSFTLKMDGSSLITGAATNTANAGSDGADNVSFVWGGSGTITNFDDIYIRDDNTYLGAQVVIGSQPNGDGATTNFTPSTGSSHFALVDDPVASTSDADYNSSNVDGDVDLYDFADLATLASAGTVNGVSVTLDVKMLSSGGRNVAVRFRKSGGSTADGTAFDVTTRSLTEKMTIFPLDPVASAAWTKAILDAGQFGIVDNNEV